VITVSRSDVTFGVPGEFSLLDVDIVFVVVFARLVGKSGLAANGTADQDLQRLWIGLGKRQRAHNLLGAYDEKKKMKIQRTT
jgi:hypothetical protein